MSQNCLNGFKGLFSLHTCTYHLCYVMSRHVTSLHFTSLHVTSRHVTSLHVTSRHVTSHHVTSHPILSYPITSHHITSHRIFSTRHVCNYNPHTSYITSYHHKTLNTNYGILWERALFLRYMDPTSFSKKYQI